MNRQLTAALATLALLAAACGGVRGPRQQYTVSRSWPAAQIEKLAVSEVNGTVSVEAVEGTEISLVATVRARGTRPVADKENQGFFQTSLSGETLSIGRVQKKKFNFFFFGDGDDLRIDYTLRVPATVSLDLNTVNGRIATRGVDGETEATTVNGSIDVETSGTSELYAQTVNGRVRAKFLRSFQGARFRTVNGGVQAILPDDASFAVDLSQVNGDFEAAFPLSIHSNPGSRRVSGDVNGGRFDLKIVTVNGDVELSKVERPVR